MADTLTTTDLQGSLPLIARGKVRDLYEVDDKTLLFVATDRISAYDVIMENVQARLSLQSRRQLQALTLKNRVSPKRAFSSLSARKNGFKSSRTPSPRSEPISSPLTFPHRSPLHCTRFYRTAACRSASCASCPLRPSSVDTLPDLRGMNTRSLELCTESP
jgi:hypothetical protein